MPGYGKTQLASPRWGEQEGAQVLPDAEPEACFRHAIAIARRQSARTWELRATTSLARLLAKQGKSDEARALLAEIYGWFTEGFDTADLKDAKALALELEHPVADSVDGDRRKHLRHRPRIGQRG
jgi:hypothetical protein